MDLNGLACSLAHPTGVFARLRHVKKSSPLLATPPLICLLCFNVLYR